LDRTRRISEAIMERHPEAFGTDYEQNKKAINDLALVPSKQLRNRIAGYIAKKMKARSEPAEEAPAPEAAGE
jgi:small subunit ribosomal protein S17e